jgi:HSP20 family protein
MFNTLFANDVRQTMESFRRSVDRLFDEVYSSPARQTGSTEARRAEWTFSPVLETAWNDTNLLIRAILPGVKQEDVHVNVQGNQLVLEGERKQPEEFGKNGWPQLSYGKFYTAVTLPSGLDLEKIACQLHDGVLDIRLPIAEAMKPRQIRIQTEGSSQKALGS